MSIQLFDNIQIGTDLTEVERFAKLGKDDSFVCKIYTFKEISYCFGTDQPAESLAARFAAKEAVRKTIVENVPFNQIEVVSAKSGAPSIVLLDKDLNNKYQFKISLTHTANLAMAVCLTIKRSE